MEYRPCSHAELVTLEATDCVPSGECVCYGKVRGGSFNLRRPKVRSFPGLTKQTDMQSYSYDGVAGTFDRSRARIDQNECSRSWNEGREKKVYTSRDTAWNSPSERMSPAQQKKYIPQRSTLNVKPEQYIPDRIEIRLCGTTPRPAPKRWLSIPDLYRVTMHAKPSPVIGRSRRASEGAVRSSTGHDSLCLHGHKYMKEMYVSQYTHHFDSDAPRSHIAGWKCDIEPHGIPHRRSRMCVLNNPMISGGSRRLADRPKSAPPSLALPFDDEVFQEDVSFVDSMSLKSEPQRVESARSASNYSIPTDADKTYEYLADGDTSSIDYYPSDDASDTSSTYLSNGKARNSSGNFSLSRPRLLRLSADFPGVRNLKKIRRKRQSMGSVSTGSQSPTPSPTNMGDYGFFVAVTSPNNQAKQHWHRPKPQRPYSAKS